MVVHAESFEPTGGSDASLRSGTQVVARSWRGAENDESGAEGSEDVALDTIQSSLAHLELGRYKSGFG